MVVAARGELSDSKVVKLRPVKVGDTTLINDGQMPGIPEDQGAPPCSSAGGEPPQGGVRGAKPPGNFFRNCAWRLLYSPSFSSSFLSLFPFFFPLIFVKN